MKFLSFLEPDKEIPALCPVFYLESPRLKIPIYYRKSTTKIGSTWS